MKEGVTVKEYKVRIIERLSTVVCVQEENAKNAEDHVRSVYRNSEIILTADDCRDAEFRVVGEAAEDEI